MGSEDHRVISPEVKSPRHAGKGTAFFLFGSFAIAVAILVGVIVVGAVSGKHGRNSQWQTVGASPSDASP